MKDFLIKVASYHSKKSCSPFNLNRWVESQFMLSAAQRGSFLMVMKYVIRYWRM